MEKNSGKYVWLYFNNEADNDNIGTSSNVCFRADDIVSMGPTSDTVLTIFFKSLRNQNTTSAQEILTDKVQLTLTTANTHFAVMEILSKHINNSRPNFGGFIDVVDDHTQIVGGGAASRTLATGLTTPLGTATKLDPKIASCAGITLVGANLIAPQVELPDLGIGLGAPTVVSAGAMAINRHFTNAVTGDATFTFPDPAATPKGSVITMVYIAAIGNGNAHTFNVHANDTTFALGSMVRVQPHDATRIALVDVAVAGDASMTHTGLTNGDGGIGSFWRAVNTTGLRDGWAIDFEAKGQGACTAASAATRFV